MLPCCLVGLCSWLISLMFTGPRQVVGIPFRLVRTRNCIPCTYRNAVSEYSVLETACIGQPATLPKASTATWVGLVLVSIHYTYTRDGNFQQRPLTHTVHCSHRTAHTHTQGPIQCNVPGVRRVGLCFPP